MVAMLETGRVKDQLEALKVTGGRCSLGGFVRVRGGGLLQAGRFWVRAPASCESACFCLRGFPPTGLKPAS